MIKHLKKKIRKSIQYLNCAAISYYQRNRNISKTCARKYSKQEEYHNFIDKNKHASIAKVEKNKVKAINCKGKWVGAVHLGDFVFGIPNSANCVVAYNIKSGNLSYFGNVGDLQYKWSGGCQYENKIYAFPRSSNSMLSIDPQMMKISLIPLNTQYKRQHHYAGVVTSSGMMCLPPRDENHILLINLKTYEVDKIYLCPHKMKLKFRYQNGIMHNDGKIYFFPERNAKILVLNPENKEFYYIGEALNCFVFDAQVCYDGNIYGFSRENGILKIDIEKQRTAMIHKNIHFGSYGTKQGLNGKIYSVPGGSSKIYEYDPKNDKVTEVSSIDEQGKAQCAGGVTLSDGSIVTIPAYGNYIYRYRFDNIEKRMPPKLKNSFFYADTY